MHECLGYSILIAVFFTFPVGYILRIPLVVLLPFFIRRQAYSQSEVFSSGWLGRLKNDPVTTESNVEKKAQVS